MVRTPENTFSRAKKTTKFLLAKENDRLSRHASGWEAVGAIASRMDRNVPLTSILNEATRECAQVLQANLFCIMMINRDGGRLDVKASVGLTRKSPQSIQLKPGESLTDAARRGLPSWACPESSLRSNKGGEASADTLGHALFIPITFRGIPLGILCLSRDRKLARFDREEVKIVLSVANQIALAAFMDGPAQAMMNRERAERDLHFAHVLTKELLPRDILDPPGYRLGARCLRCLNMGGDFYDCIPLPEGRMAAVVGESSGQGVQPALIMAHLIPGIRGCFARGLALADVARWLNEDMIGRGKRGRMVSLCLVELDAAAHRLHLTRVGNTAVRLVQGAAIRELELGNGTPLGLLSDYEVAVESVDLSPGSALLLTTDGLNKCLDDNGAAYSRQHLEEAIKSRCREKSNLSLADCIASHLDRHLSGRMPEDDITILSLERL